MTPTPNKLQPRQALAFARYAKSMLLNDGDVLRARAYAEGQAWNDTPGTNLALKSAVDAMSSSNTSDLAVLRPIAREFISVVRAQSVLGRLVGLRRVPENVSMLKTTSGPTAHWVAEGRAAPLSTIPSERESLTFSKVQASIVVTQELLLRSGAVADLALATELINAVAEFEDVALLNPDLAESVDNPASITHGAPSVESTGTSAAAIRADLKGMFLSFGDTAALERAQLVMHPRSALHLSLLEP